MPFQYCWLLVTLYLAAQSYGSATKSTAAERHERYEALLTEYFAAPRHPFVNKQDWINARFGIMSEFEKIMNNLSNVTMDIQRFKTEISYSPNFPSEVDGENIIVTFEGRNWRTERDQILVIGAHYDSDGAPMLSLDDNGSGVVAMLEVARGLADAIVDRKAILLNTVIFVAFDIQTYEHEHTAVTKHSPGSDFFVKERLSEILKNEPNPSFLGAIILDSVMNYNNTPYSQVLPDSFDSSFSQTADYIMKNELRGNYLALVTKEALRSVQLDNFFLEQWNSSAAASRFPLLTHEISRKAPSKAVFEFLKQDHMAFWNYGENALPAILITDTSKWRGIQRSCSERKCNSTTLITRERLELLDQVVVTLDKFVSKSQLDGKVGIDTTGSSNIACASIVATLFTVLVSHLL